MKKMNLLKIMGLIAFTLQLSGCSDDELPEFTKLEKLRIIALELSNPEVSPGATVTVTPWLSDITEATGLSDSVSVCVDPGISFGVSPTCDGNSTKVDIRTNFALTVTGSDFTGSANNFSVTIPVDAIVFATASAQDQWNGVSYLIDYRLQNSRGEQARAIRRIIVSSASKTSKNSNPIVSDIFANGVSMVSLPLAGAQVSLSTDLTTTSEEVYQVQDSKGALQLEVEKLTVTWMLTDGETEFFRTSVGESVLFTGPDAAPSGRQAHILAVVRDDRGGVRVIKKEF